jgi:excisionase family DNA binding protein
MEPTTLYTVQEVADILGVHENTIYNAIKDKRLAAFRLGGSKANYRITQAALNAYLTPA